MPLSVNRGGKRLAHKRTLIRPRRELMEMNGWCIIGGNEVSLNNQFLLFFLSRDSTGAYQTISTYTEKVGA